MSILADFKNLFEKETHPVSETTPTPVLPVTGTVTEAIPSVLSATAAPFAAIVSPAPIPAASPTPTQTEVMTDPATIAASGSVLSSDIATVIAHVTAPVPTVTATPARTLSVVSSALESAVSDLESFIASPDAHFEAWLKTNWTDLKTTAAADYTKIVAEKNKLVADLESELSGVGTWFTSKIIALRAKL